jgi:hypothetical protein
MSRMADIPGESAVVQDLNESRHLDKRPARLAGAVGGLSDQRCARHLLCVERIRPRARARIRMEPSTNIPGAHHRHGDGRLDVFGGGVSAAANRTAAHRHDRGHSVRFRTAACQLDAVPADALSHMGRDGRRRYRLWLPGADHSLLEMVSPSSRAGQRPGHRNVRRRLRPLRPAGGRVGGANRLARHLSGSGGGLLRVYHGRRLPAEGSASTDTPARPGNPPARDAPARIT